MELTHRFRLPVPVEEAWATFSQLERLAPSLPGGSLTATGPDSFRGTVSVKIGPVPLTYTGTLSYQERSALRRRVVVQARGEAERGLGGAVARVTTTLHARGAETEVEVVTDLELSGRPTRYGPSVVAQAGDRLVDQLVSSLTERFAAGTLTARDGSDAARAVPVGTGPAGDVGMPVDVGAAARAAVEPRHRDGRAPVGGLHLPRRARPRSGVAVLARRHAPLALAAAGAVLLALRLLRRR